MPSQPARILVVDDEPLICDLLQEILRRFGHRVVTAVDGVEACRQVRQTRFDLVITDVRMPRMDGIELYRNLVGLRPELEGRILFTTGNLMDEATEAFLKQVHAPALAKPLGLAQVVAAVDRALS